MEERLDLRTVFSVLGMRFHFFEASLHLIKDSEDDLGTNRHFFDYIGIIDKIGRDVNRYDPTEVYQLASEYADRGGKILAKFPEQKKANTEIASSKWEMWGSEIREYLIHLFAIKGARETIARNKQSESNSTVSHTDIHLPENFQVADFKDVYTPKLSVKQAALFLHFLRTLGYLPYYSDSSLAELAKAFFARNSQNVRRELTRISEIKAERKELDELKKLLESMIKEIQEEY